MRSAAASTSTPTPTHVTLNVVFLFLMTLAQALTIIVLLMQTLGVGPHQAAPTEGDPFAMGEAAGHAAMRSLMWVWAVAGLAWAPTNAIGLLARKPWARLSTLGYWCASALVCCPIPLAIYGIFSMTRPAVRVFLEGPGEPV